MRDEELMIKNRLERTHIHTCCSDIMGQECRAEEPTTERDGRGGGLAFFVLAEEKKGEHGERGKGLWPGFKVSRCCEHIQHKKVKCTQVQLPTAKVSVGFNWFELGVKYYGVLTVIFSG